MRFYLILLILILNTFPSFALDNLDTNKISISDYKAIINQIKQNHVEEFDESELIKKSIKTLLTSIDNNSEYIDYESFLNIKKMKEDSLFGIGIVIQPVKNGARIAHLYKETPASRAQILVNDIITKVNGKNLSGMNIDSIAKLFQGRVGDLINLSILRDNKIIQDIKVPIEKIDSNPVEMNTLEDGSVLYIQIKHFSKSISSLIRQKYLNLNLSKRLSAIVLDLRNNPGGLLEEAILVSNLFLKRGKIVIVKGRNPKYNKAFSAMQNRNLFENTHLVVLINKMSASASEVVSSSLQENKRAIIIGETSFGKGSVQEFSELPDKIGAIKLTVANYYTPTGKKIEGIGVTPDITEDIDSNYLKKAIEILKIKQKCI